MNILGELNLKNKVSLDDRIKTINTVVEACFLKNKDSNEVRFTPYYKDYTLKMCFGLYFLDGIEFEKDDDITDIIENTNNLCELYDSWTNSTSYWEINQDITDILDFKKQQLLNSNNEVTKYVLDLLKDQISAIKLQKKILQNTDKINGQYTKEETLKITEIMENFSNRLNDPEIQKGLVQSISETKAFKTPEDHKSPRKK